VGADPQRPGDDVATALRAALIGIMTGPTRSARGAKLVARYRIKEAGPLLRDMVADAKRPSALRVGR